MLRPFPTAYSGARLSTGPAVAAKGTDSNSSGEMKSVRHNLEEEILEQLVRVVVLRLLVDMVLGCLA